MISPYFLNIGKQTTFFSGPVVPVSEELMADAIQLLHPSSALVHLRDYKSAHNLITVEADIQEISAIKRCKVGFDEVPMRRVAKCQINHTGVTVIISSNEGSENLQLLLEDGQVFTIKQDTWQPLDEALMEKTLKVDLQVQGNLIKKITVLDREI
ncbi:uncharacterized protein V6R79_002028 [Siganus canaliculatus]